MSQARARRVRLPWWLTAVPVLVVLVGLLTALMAWITGQSWPQALAGLLVTAGQIALVRPLLARFAEKD